LLDIVELAGRVAAAYDRADRGAGDDVGGVALGDQRADDADMGKAAGRPAAEHKPDTRPLCGCLSGCVRVHVHGLIAILSAASEKVEHVRFLSRNISRVARARKCFAPLW
jgi:hypothetical protein